MKAPPNHVIIEVDSEFNDTIETKSGVKLYAPTGSYDHAGGYGEATQTELDRKKTYGKVVAVPDKLTKQGRTICNVPSGRYRNNKPVQRNVTADEMQIEVAKGATVHFRYNSTQEEWAFTKKGKRYFKVPYDNLFAIEEDGELQAVAGKAILRVQYDQEDYGQFINPFKKKLVDRGKAVSLAKPLRGHRPVPAQKGDTVIFELKEIVSGHEPCEWIEFKGEKLWVIYLTEIIAVL